MHRLSRQFDIGAHHCFTDACVRDPACITELKRYFLCGGDRRSSEHCSYEPDNLQQQQPPPSTSDCVLFLGNLIVDFIFDLGDLGWPLIF